MGKRRRRSPSISSDSDSSSSSSSSADLKKELKRLKKQVTELQQNRSTSSVACSGDEFLIPIFDPGKDDQLVERWVERVNKLAARFHWDNDAIIRLISSRIRGNARQWYDEQVKYDITWEQLQESMMEQFRKCIPFSKLLEDASSYKTIAGQSLGDYCFQKLSKLRMLNLEIPNEYLVDAVIGGITDVNIARTVRSARHVDPNALYAYLNSLGNMPNDTEKNFGQLSKPSTSAQSDAPKFQYFQNIEATIIT